MKPLLKLKKPIINFFLQSRDFGGAEKFAHDLIIEFSKKDVYINFYTNNNYLLQNLNNKKNITIKRIPVYLDFASNGRGFLKSLFLTPLAILYFWKILSVIKKQKTKQVLFCSGFSEKIILAPLAKLFILPIYFIEYGPLEPLFTKLFGIPKILYYLVKNYATKVIVPSKNTELSLKNTFKQEKMFLIPCGSPNPTIKKTKERIKSKSIVVISRLEKGKGQDLLIKAFKLVQKQFTNSELSIIGQGNFKNRLIDLAQNDPKIKFLNYVRDKQLILEKSEVIVCPSVWPLEGFGLTIIEAMALKKPIVAFDRAPGNEMLRSNHNALLAKDGDINDLAQKIMQLFSNPKLAQKLANNAKKDFQNKYQISKIAEKYLTLLQN